MKSAELNSLTWVEYKVETKAHLPWVGGQTFRIPLPAHAEMPSSGWKPSPDIVSFVRELCIYTAEKPTASRLPVSYRIVPDFVRNWIASSIGRLQRNRTRVWAKFPAWPLDLTADLLADLCGTPNPFRNQPTPVILSHDLDSQEGVDNSLRYFLPMEEKLGARSVNYVVPCRWKLDYQQLKQFVDRGHELGIHGYDHSNLTAYAGKNERETRIEKGLELAQAFGMRGYRAPSLIRTRELLQSLRGKYAYDSSVPTSGGLFPVPNNGCASARPFWLEGVPEIPLSMPRDGSLLFLGYKPDEILGLWKECAVKISDSGGVIMLLTHCERRFSGQQAMLDVYARFLNWISEQSRFAWSSTDAVLKRMERAPDVGTVS